MDEHAGELRSLVAGRPTAESWSQLIRLLERTPLDEAMHDYLLGKLRAWPTQLRAAPSAWVEALLAGQDVPYLDICASLSVRRRALDADAIDTLGHHQALRHVRALHLSYRCLDDAGVAALVGSRLAGQLVELSLKVHGLGPSAVEAIASSDKLAALEALSLRNNRIGDDGALHLARSSNLASLRSLDVESNGIKTRGIRALAERAGDLDHLCLSVNTVRITGARALADARGLKRLELRLSHLGDAGLEALSQGLDAVATLDVRHNALGPQGIAALSRAAHLSDLVSLELGSNALGDDSAELLALAPWAENLRELGIFGGEFTERGVRLLLGEGRFAGLAHLKLGAHRLGDAGAQAIADHPPALRSLEMAESEVSCRGLVALAEALPELERVDMPLNAIAGQGVVALARGCPALRKLNLSSNLIDSDALIDALADRSQLSELEELDLSINPIDDRGAAALADAPQLAGLRVLDLGSTDITARGAATLADSPYLRATIRRQWS